MIAKPFVCVLLTVLATPVWASTSGCVTLEEGWVRLPPMAAMPMAAGFGTIRNACDTAVAVTSARSSELKAVSIHETTQVDGVSRMREVEQLPVAAKGAIELRPGGLHLMLARDSRQLHEGQRVPLVLTLADGSEMQGELVVRKSAP